MGERKQNLVVYHGPNRYIVENVDSAQYGYQQMKLDVYRAVFDQDPGNLNSSIRIRCGFPGLKGIFEVQDDADVKRMLKLHQGVKEIDVFLMQVLETWEELLESPPYEIEPFEVIEDRPIRFDYAAQDENTVVNQQNVANNEIGVENVRAADENSRVEEARNDGGVVNEEQQPENENSSEEESVDDDDDGWAMF